MVVKVTSIFTHFKPTRAENAKAFAKHEIILTAGSFNTAKLLMLSRIGPDDHLSQHNIPLIKHLSGVGQSLKDHPAVFPTALVSDHLFSRAAFESSPSLTAAAKAQWEQDGTGETATQFSSLPVIFNKLPNVYNTPEFHALKEREKEYLKRDAVPIYEAAFMGPKIPPTAEVPVGKDYLSFFVFAMNPQGSGTVSLASANPEGAAIIDPKALSHAFDKMVLVEALIDAIEIFKGMDIYKEGFEGWLNGLESLERDVVKRFVEEQTMLMDGENG
jgi:choline dehydrogenase-like flavoprotein